jgi:hypothetical protein
LQSQTVGDNLSAGFADVVALYVEEPFRSHLGMAQATATLPKRDALELLVKGFERAGCFAPRASRRELLLASRVPLMTLAATDRVGALALKLRAPSAATGIAAVMTFVARGYAEPRTAPLTEVIAITAPRAYQDNVLAELSEGRRPASCNEEWMNPVFAAP